jgi:hypothetical protein
MGCSPTDLKAYLLGELERREKSGVEQHVAACAVCREELDALRLTQTALLTLPEEEIPQRIAFVSDKVFEPRWWQRAWQSAPVMGFASALVLAGAILVHGFTRPSPAPAQATVDTARIEQQVEREVSQRVDAAVAKAVADVEVRQAAATEKRLAALEKKYDLQRKDDLVAVKEMMLYYEKKSGSQTAMLNNMWGRQ